MKNLFYSFHLSKFQRYAVCLFFICLIQTMKLTAADTALVQILHADALKIVNINGANIKKLIGHVQLQHNDAVMNCDSAIINEQEDVDAQGHIVVHKGANITMTGNTLYYQSAEKFATVRGNVRLSDAKMTLQTNELFYDMPLDAGYYINRGLVTSQENKIRSVRGIYYAKDRDVFFKEDVTVTNPKFKLKSDTLKYNVDNEIATFYGGTQIYNDSSTIWCKTGWYNTKTNISSFGANTILLNMPQWMQTDSLYYEKNTGYGRVLKKYEYHDTALHMTMEGNFAEYFEKQNRVIGYNRPLLTYEQDRQNLLFMRADTFITKEINGIKSFYGYKKVRMFKNDFQAVCDTLIYSLSDSTFRLFNRPLLWNDSTQLSADTIFLLTKNKKPFKADLLQNAMAAEHLMTYAFNQIAGRTINIYFKAGKTDFLHAIQDARSKYYGREEGKGYQGLNTSESKEIKAYFVEGKVDRIQFLGLPKAVFTPIKKLGKQDYYLLNFSWKGALRPKSKEDL